MSSGGISTVFPDNVDNLPGPLLASPPSPLPLSGQLALEHRLPRLHAPPLLLDAQPHLQTVEGGQEGVEYRAGLSDSNVAQEPLIGSGARVTL